MRLGAFAGTPLLFITLSPLLGADTLVLANGDRLSGRYLGEANGQHRFRSEMLGEISVPVAKAKVEKSPKTATPKDAVAPPLVSPPADKTAAPASPQADDSDSFSSWWNENRPLKDWKSRFVFSMTWQQGERNRTDYTIDFNTQRTVGANDYRYILEHSVGTQPNRFGNSYKVADRWFTEFRWRHTLSERFFTQTNTSYLTDQVKRIDHRAEQSVGIGYIYLKDDKWTGTITPALTVKNQQLGGRDAGTDLYGSLFQDLAWRPTPRITLGQDAMYSFDLNEQANYNWVAGLRFEAKLDGGLTYNLRYTYDYDHYLPLGIQREQQRLTTGFGYSF